MVPIFGEKTDCLIFGLGVGYNRNIYMSSLKTSEKIYLENFFEMNGGYVCDFSDRTFREFILENIGVDVFSEQFSYEAEPNYKASKAKRLRHFWKNESDKTTYKLLNALYEYWIAKKEISGTLTVETNKLAERCKKIIIRLKENNTNDDLEAFTENLNADESLELLAVAIKDSIKKGVPVEALDRLHTYIVRFLRILLKKHKVAFEDKDPLHSLWGSYIKILNSKGVIKSEMVSIILKPKIAESFNDVRNNQSLAHDNEFLNPNESRLVFNHLTNILRFITAIEKESNKWNLPQIESAEILGDIGYSDAEIDAAGDWWIQQQIDIQRGK